MSTQPVQQSDVAIPEEESSSIPGGDTISAAGHPVEVPRQGWRDSFAALSQRAYFWVWCSLFFSNIGTFVHNTTKHWVVYASTGSAAWLGFDTFCSGLPQMMLLPISGVLADRMDRRRLLIISSLAGFALAAALSLRTALGHLEVWNILLVSLGIGMADCMRVPAYQAYLPTLVGKNRLANAVALNSVQFNTSRVIGPALGGLLLLWYSPAVSFAFNAVSFLAVVLALVLAAPPGHPPPGDPIPVWRSLREGLQYLRPRRDLHTLLAIVIVNTFLGAAGTTLAPALVNQAHDGGKQHYSMLLSMAGVGAALGAVAMAARSHRRSSLWRSAIAMMTLGAAQIAIGISPRYEITALLYLICGVAFVSSNIRIFTLWVQLVPDRLRGRLTSFWLLAFSAGAPLGGLFAGFVARSLGVRAAFSITGLLLLLLVPTIMILRRRDMPDLSDVNPADPSADRPGATP